MEMRHKWIFDSQVTNYSTGTDLSKQYYSQYKCEYCGLQKRLYERISERAFSGTTVDECILVNGKWKILYEGGFKMPKCKGRHP
jgi:hypothetical protein